ncbi:DUF4097 family beta strand repeat-containing protein [Paraflavitalea pollutisoli]|uniref:DUF4097 family beta strand repeat-containing protein n=1 Tax=Paraflavitalea pollutisoli TaxID=3034143 RepID=UPI0023ECBAC4|nr:DUF4097 family beta strand repeat-containing protein [Paraflavitalea sp. H1-2-19X]
MNNKKIIPALLLTGSLILTATAMQAQKTLTKEVSQEVPSQKGALIRLVTSSRKVVLKPWDQSKVKVTMEVSYDSGFARKANSDADWFETFGVNIKPFSNRVDILTGTGSGIANTRVYNNAGKQVFVTDLQTLKAKAGTINGQGNFSSTDGVTVQGYKAGKPAVELMTIMVPAGCKLDLENKYGDIVIGMNVDEAKLKVSNGALDAQDIKDLKLEGTFCNANLGNIDKAEIEFTNGTFRAQNINDLDMDTKSSTVEYEKGKYLYLRSQNDNLTIDAIDKIDGRKVYGSIKIDQLNNSFDLEGNNVDIKFRNISQDVTLIKINNKYGDVRLPVKGLTNYYVDFIGNYSTVFAPFQKEVVKEEEKKPAEGEAAAKSTLEDVRITYARKGTGTSLGEVAPRHFTSTVGDTKGKHTRIELTCHSCTVDFK